MKTKTEVDLLEWSFLVKLCFAVCESLSSGGTTIVDLTWSGSDQAEKVAQDVGIPYVRIDISISPSLRLLDQYLEHRNSTDVTLIFDDPSSKVPGVWQRFHLILIVEVDEALYFWIDTTLLRMVISEDLDKTTANRLKAIRPIPNNFAIVATTSNMEELFQTVLFLLTLLALDQK